MPNETQRYAAPSGAASVPALLPREGWAEAARRMHDHCEDQLLDEPTSTRFEEEEWEW